MDASTPSSPLTGLVAAVAAAEILADVTGGWDGALRVAALLPSVGSDALPPVDDNAHRALTASLQRAGVLLPSGRPDLARTGEFLTVCVTLAAQRPPRAAAPDCRPLVFSAPADVVNLDPQERLDGLVIDVIRHARHELLLGGPFWDNLGFDALSEVLIPAMKRGARVTFVVDRPSEASHRANLQRQLSHFATYGDLRALWYGGPSYGLMHAKFVVADHKRGYVGTANLTSWGFGTHIEVGVELLPGQCEQLHDFVERLEAAGLFVSDPNDPR